MTASSAKAEIKTKRPRSLRGSWSGGIARAIIMLGLFSSLWNLLGCGPDETNKSGGFEKLPDSRPPMRPLPAYGDIEKALNSKIWSERSGAVLDVLRGKHRKAIPILFRLLQKDPHPAVRQTAALALADFKEKRAVPVIARMLTREKNVSPDYMMDALQRLGDPRGGRAVAPYLDSENHIYRLKAVAALAAMKAKGQGGRILAMARRNRDPAKAKTYAMALGKLGVTSAGPYLLKVAKTAEPGPTLAAAYLALGRTKTRKAVPMLAKAMAGEFPRGRENATIALITIKDKGALKHVFPLVEHAQEEVRYLAAKVVVGIPAAASGPRALELLKRKEARLIGPAAFIVGRLKHQPARETVESMFADVKSPERERLGRTIGWLGNKASIPLLIRVLREKDGEGRYGAAWSLGILEAVEALDDLMKTARGSDRKLAQLSVSALGALGSPKALPDLERMARKEPGLSLYAMDAIEAVPGEEARLVLEKIAASEDGEIKIRRRAIQALGRRKSKKSIPLLIKILKEGPGETHRVIRNSLAAITGTRFDTRNEWLNWYSETGKR